MFLVTARAFPILLSFIIVLFGYGLVRCTLTVFLYADGLHLQPSLVGSMVKMLVALHEPFVKSVVIGVV